MEEIQIFISYASEDQARVRVIYDKLVARGFRPWLDREHILPGQKWEPVIKQALKRSDFVLVCLSATSINKRGFLQTEIRQALEQAKEKLEGDVYLIPARLDDCEVPEMLSEIQWVDLFDDNGWEQLLRAFDAQLNKLGKQMPLAQNAARLAEEKRAAEIAERQRQQRRAEVAQPQTKVTQVKTAEDEIVGKNAQSDRRRLWQIGGAALTVALLVGIAWRQFNGAPGPPNNSGNVGTTPTSVVPTPTVEPPPEQKPSPNPTLSPTTAPLPKNNNVSPERLRQQAAEAVGRANTLYEQGQFNQAIGECNRALQLDPGNRKARELKGKIQKTQKILEEKQ